MADDGNVRCRVFLQNLCKFAQGGLCLVAQCCGVEAEQNTCRKGYFDSRQAVGIRYLLHLGTFNLAASAAFLSILCPMATPAPVPTAAPTAAPMAAPLPLPISPPIMAPAAAPEPPPIIPPFALFVHGAATAQQQCTALKTIL